MGLAVAFISFSHVVQILLYTEREGGNIDLESRPVACPLVGLSCFHVSREKGQHERCARDPNLCTRTRNISSKGDSPVQLDRCPDGQGCGLGRSPCSVQRCPNVRTEMRRRLIDQFIPLIPPDKHIHLLSLKVHGFV